MVKDLMKVSNDSLSFLSRFSNHSSTTQFFCAKGHYYAYWYNFAKQTWYRLDDDSVFEVTEKQVGAAYNGRDSACTLEYIRSSFQSSWMDEDLKLMVAEAKTDSSEPAGFSPLKLVQKFSSKVSSWVGSGKNTMKPEGDAVSRAKIEMLENQRRTGAENILHHNRGFRELDERTDALKKKIIKKDPGLYRCLSKREGCHALNPYLDTEDVNKAHDLPLCPPSMLSLLKTHPGSPVEDLQERAMRVGVIDLQHQEGRNDCLDFKIKYNSDDEDEIMIGLIVLQGEYNSCKTGNEISLFRISNCLVAKMEEVKDRRIYSGSAHSFILVIYFFKALLFDSIVTASPHFDLKKVCQGFSSTGIVISNNRNESTHAMEFKPVYTNAIRKNTTPEASLFQALVAFFEEENDEIQLDKKNIIRCWKDDAFAGIVKEIKNYPGQQDFRLIVIENTSDGFKDIYGKRKILWSKADSNPCLLYLHDVCRPTIPSFDAHARKIFVLLKQSNATLQKDSVGYLGTTYPIDFDPYRNLSIQPISSLPSITFPSQIVEENHLRLTESQKKYGVLLSGLADEKNASLFATTGGDIVTIDSNLVAVMKNGDECLNDQHIELLISMYVFEK